MTDRTPPPDLIDKLHRTIFGEATLPKAGLWTSVERQAIRNYLEALAEWADGALIDPATWQRIDREPVGWDWCGSAASPLPGHRNLDPCGSDTPLFTLTPRSDR